MIYKDSNMTKLYLQDCSYSETQHLFLLYASHILLNFEKDSINQIININNIINLIAAIQSNTDSFQLKLFQFLLKLFNLLCVASKI